jgi:hypothetical protein
MSNSDGVTKFANRTKGCDTSNQANKSNAAAFQVICGFTDNGMLAELKIAFPGDIFM